MTNPFDDPDGTYLVLVNAEGQHSLWPEFAAIPDGWTRVHGPAPRQSCLDHVEANWTDMRPNSLAARDTAQANGA
jgi:MbtH protein